MLMWSFTLSSVTWHRINKCVSAAFLSYGVMLIGGVALQDLNGLRLFDAKTSMQVSNQAMPFLVVKNMAELEQQLLLAKQKNQSVLLDFYADWCASCVAMDKYVFTQPTVKHALSQLVLLRADVTKNNAFDQALLKRFHVIAPPTMVFFNRVGQVLPMQQIVGEVGAETLLADLKKASESEKIKYCKAGMQYC
jgi:thiol:disulfide interchange protein DsbD